MRPEAPERDRTRWGQPRPGLVTRALHADPVDADASSTANRISVKTTLIESGRLAVFDPAAPALHSHPLANRISVSLQPFRRFKRPTDDNSDSDH